MITVFDRELPALSLGTESENNNSDARHLILAFVFTT
jgi:hypothetical protein